MDKEIQQRSDAYQFLFSKMPADVSIPRQEPIVNQFSSKLPSFQQDFSFTLNGLNTIKTGSDEKGIELEQDFSEDLMDQSDSVTIGEIDSPIPEKEESAWILLGEGQNDLKGTPMPSEGLGLLYKHCVVSSKQEVLNRENVTKESPLSEDKSEDGTFCWDNLKVRISPKQKQKAKHSKTLGTPNADWNYFSLRRACFRGMSAYYKDRFNAFVKNSGFTKSLKLEMDKIVSKFIEEEFYQIDTGNCDISRPEFLDWMITVLHSHRHKKNESYIRRRDFTKIRQVLYSFSTAAKKTFLACPDYAMVLYHFYNRQGDDFLVKKSELKPAKFRNELEVELNALYKGATQTLGF